MIGTTPTPALKCFDDSTFGGLQILKGKSEVLGTFCFECSMEGTKAVPSVTLRGYYSY